MSASKGYDLQKKMERKSLTTIWRNWTSSKSSSIQNGNNSPHINNLSCSRSRAIRRCHPHLRLGTRTYILYICSQNEFQIINGCSVKTLYTRLTGFPISTLTFFFIFFFPPEFARKCRNSFRSAPSVPLI